MTLTRQFAIERAKFYLRMARIASPSERAHLQSDAAFWRKMAQRTVR